jgi:hypothetical protein
MLEETITSDSETGGAAVPVSFQAGIGIETRVSNSAGNQWDATDTIGLYMIRHGSTLADSVIRESAKNKPYKVSSGAGENKATFVTASDTIYYPNGEEVNFIAYYPYSDKAAVVSADFKYRMDISDQSLPSRLDLLYSNNKTAYSSKNHAAVLPFEHLMTRVVFDAICAPGSNMSLTGLQLEMHNVNTSTDFDLSTGSPASDGAGQGVIIPLKHTTDRNDSVRMEATLIPMANASGVQLLFSLNNKAYKAPLPPTSSGTALQKGKRYTYKVLFDEAEISLDGQLSAWNEEPSDTLAPTPQSMAFIEGYSGKVTLTYASDATETFTLMDGKGGFGAAHRGELIRSLTLDALANPTPILIGCKVADGLVFSLKVDAAGKPVLRDEVDGYIPIGSYAELQLINESANLGKKYKQETHLDLMSANWTPIGTQALPFTGEYNGGEYEIANLKIEGTANQVGLFGYINKATLHNIRLVSGSVNGGSIVGGICGLGEDITVVNCRSAATVTGTEYVGGISGQTKSSSTITSCYTSGAVKTTASFAGGITGNASGTVKIKDCYNRGSVEGNSIVGGIAGHANNTAIDIIACCNSGAIKSTGGDHAGGIVGLRSNNGTLTLTACYNTGTVSGSATGNNTGGIIGQLNTAASTLTACYSTGTVTGTAATTGLICGSRVAGTIATCYWTKGSSTASKGVGSGTDSGTKAFSASAWPATSESGWGIGDGSGANKYWKSLGRWNSGTPAYPKLYWE